MTRIPTQASLKHYRVDWNLDHEGRGEITPSQDSSFWKYFFFSYN